jgi:hypothetical protein
MMIDGTLTIIVINKFYSSPDTVATGLFRVFQNSGDVVDFIMRIEMRSSDGTTRNERRFDYSR